MKMQPLMEKTNTDKDIVLYTYEPTIECEVYHTNKVLLGDSVKRDRKHFGCTLDDYIGRLELVISQLRGIVKDLILEGDEETVLDILDELKVYEQVVHHIECNYYVLSDMLPPYEIAVYLENTIEGFTVNNMMFYIEGNTDNLV